MLLIIDQLAENLGLTPQVLVILSMFLGAFLIILSIAFTIRADANRLTGKQSQTIVPESLFVASERAPTGLSKALLPTEDRERSRVRRDLAHAGFYGPNAVALYYLLRIVIGLLLPCALVLVWLIQDQLSLTDPALNQIGRLDLSHLLFLFGITVTTCFFGPVFWLSARARSRRKKIEAGFPNALDLLQVSIEAGLGFDAALARVAEELEPVNPEISTEFRIAMQELLAGRDRERAYHALSERLAIEEANSFVFVVLQSLRFGTSMSQALQAYSNDMRQRRELRAQEKANKLPVYMSAVMAALMMPALLVVTIGPVVIRYMRGF